MQHTLFTYHSPLGLMVAECEHERLTGLRFTDAAFRPQEAGEAPAGLRREVCRWLDAYFAGGQPTFLPPLSLRGTPYQERVWQELLHVPYGHTISYGALAQRLNQPLAGQPVGHTSARAVGHAVGRNPLALMVPCHRVVGSDGTLTGYAYGLARKRSLLQLEGAGMLPDSVRRPSAPCKII